MTESRALAPRRHSSRWLVAWALLSVGALVVAFLVGRSVRSPWDDAVSNAAASPVVTAVVEQREFSPSSPTLQGELSVGESLNVAAVVGAGPAVVTAARSGVGDEIRSGSLIVEVSGRPILALQLPFPLYRDLGPGASGADVAAVQRELADLGHYRGAVDGEYGPRTSAAVRSLYSKAGVVAQAVPVAVPSEVPESTQGTGASGAGEGALVQGGAPSPSGVLLPLGEVLSIRDDSYVVTRIEAVGTVLPSDSPVAAVITGGAASVSARVGVVDVDSFAVGDAVLVGVVGANGATVSGEITQIGEFSSGDAQVAGFAVTIGLSEAPRDVRDKSVVTVSRVDAGTAVSALAVPLLGVREDERGTFVLAAVDAAGDAGQSRRIDIETGAVSGGYVEVVSGDLAEGDLVVVAGA